MKDRLAALVDRLGSPRVLVLGVQSTSASAELSATREPANSR